MRKNSDDDDMMKLGAESEAPPENEEAAPEAQDAGPDETIDISAEKDK